MRTDAFIGLVVFGALLTPLAAMLVLRQWGKLHGLRRRDWLMLYVLGALACLVVLERKHLEAAIIMRWPRSYWAYTSAQIDNEWWEQVGKLAAIAIGVRLAGDRLRPLLQSKRTALALGYWTGLCYGIGEALILAALFAWPRWAPLFGMKTFTLYSLGWPFVRERLWAMHLHAVMGALVGLGLFGLIGLRSKARFVLFFVLAMLYHHLVDGLIITAAFVPDLAKVMNQAGELLVPALWLVGFVLLALVYAAAGRLSVGDGLDTSGRNA